MKGSRKEDVLVYEIKIIPDRESGYFAVRFPDFPGIVTGEYSLERAMKNGNEALEVTLETMKKHKLSLPKPKTRFSGQFNVRVPRRPPSRTGEKGGGGGCEPKCTRDISLVPIHQDRKSSLILIFRWGDLDAAGIISGPRRAGLL